MESTNKASVCKWVDNDNISIYDLYIYIYKWKKSKLLENPVIQLDNALNIAR